MAGSAEQSREFAGNLQKNRYGVDQLSITLNQLVPLKKPTERIQPLANNTVDAFMDNCNDLGTDFLEWLKARDDTAINIYIQSKLSTLVTNASPDLLDQTRTINNLLQLYMFLNETFEDTRDFKEPFKHILKGLGIYSEEIGELVLLIGEKIRTFDDAPQDRSEEELTMYFFDKYKGHSERWDRKAYRFAHQSYASQDSAEREAMMLLARSRASEAKVIDPPPEKAQELISKADNFFQTAYKKVFHKDAPFKLEEVTNVTSDFTEHADRISNKTFIYVNHLDDPDEFIHLVLHEGMHLSFNQGLDQRMVEEGLIEVYIEDMFDAHPVDNMRYSPVSKTYGESAAFLRHVFQLEPGMEEAFTQYFHNGDLQSLQSYISSNLSGDLQQRILAEYYRNGWLYLRDIVAIAE